MLAPLQRLGVEPSYSRPKVSDDNPYTESLFRTLKYCPQYPEAGFQNIEEARAWVRKFVEWYNNVHFHRGINWTTPSSRHIGEEAEILKNRKEIYEKARTKNSNRWSQNTRNWSRVEDVKLNPGREKKKEELLKKAG